MEKENKKVIEEEKTKYVESIKCLVEFIKINDPRMK